MFSKASTCFILIVMVQSVPDPLMNGVSILSDEYIDYLNGLNSTWKAGRNFAEHIPIEHFRGLCGSLDHQRPLKLTTQHYEIADDEIPNEFDCRVKWPECETMRIIRDQGSCGSCWAFAAVEAMSDRICVASDQQINVMISAENLITCCGLDCGNGCGGGYSEGAWQYWVQKGLVSGGLYNDDKTCQPYTIPSCEHDVDGPRPQCYGTVETPDCKQTCQPVYEKNFQDDLYFGRDFYSVYFEDMQKEIMTYGPVEVAFTVYADFVNYKSGVYVHKSDVLLGGHCVKIIGWGEENNTPYWLAANSWNEDWGDNGYFKILRGQDECGIEGYVVAGLPDLN